MDDKVILRKGLRIEEIIYILARTWTPLCFGGYRAKKQQRGQWIIWHPKHDNQEYHSVNALIQGMAQIFPLPAWGVIETAEGEEENEISS